MTYNDSTTELLESIDTLLKENNNMIQKLKSYATLHKIDSADKESVYDSVIEDLKQYGLYERLKKNNADLIFLVSKMGYFKMCENERYYKTLEKVRKTLLENKIEKLASYIMVALIKGR